MAVYLVVDKDGTVTNAIEWDGVTRYTPPAGAEAVRVADVPPRTWIESKRTGRGAGAVWTAPPERAG